MLCLLFTETIAASYKAAARKGTGIRKVQLLLWIEEEEQKKKKRVKNVM